MVHLKNSKYENDNFEFQDFENFEIFFFYPPIQCARAIMKLQYLKIFHNRPRKHLPNPGFLKQNFQNFFKI